MPFTSAVRDVMLDQTDEGSATVPATHASLHTGDPSTTGANEVTGGSYVRVAITWSAASGGSKTLTAAVVLQVPAGTTITHAGTWSASSGGTFRGGAALDASQAYPTAGTYTLNLTETLA